MDDTVYQMSQRGTEEGAISLGKLLEVCVWDVRGSDAFMCGHWCAYKHVCVPMYASMLSLYMCYACM